MPYYDYNTFEMDSVDSPEQRVYKEPPGIFESIGTGFRVGSPTLNVFNYDYGPADVEKVDPTHNAWKFIEGTRMQKHWESFVGSFNLQKSMTIAGRIAEEEDRNLRLSAAGYSGMFGELMGGVVDPTLLMPGLGLVRAVKGGYAVGRSALKTGALTGVGVGIQEAALQATQYERTAGESFQAVGVGVLLGGLVGGVAAGLYSKAEARAMKEAYDFLNTGGGTTYKGSSAGAHFVGEMLTKDDLTIAGDFTKWQAEKLAFNPGLRLMTSPIEYARKVAANIGELAFYFKGGETGDVSQHAIETAFNMKYKARMGTSIEAVDEIYKAARKEGLPVKRAAFEELVGIAMRNGDTSPIAAVQKAAESYRKQLVDPTLRDMLDTGLVTAKQIERVKGAQTYFPRWIDQAKVNAQEPKFKSIIKRRVIPWLQESYIKSVEATDAKIKELQDHIEVLNKRGDARADMMADIEAGLERVDIDHAEAVKIQEQIHMLTSFQRDFEKNGKHFDATNVGEEIKRLRKAHETELTAMRAARRGMERTRAVLEKGYEASEEQVDKLINDLIGMDEANLRKVEGLVNKGREIERKLAKVQTPEEKDELLEKLSEDFTKAADGFYAARDRLVASQKKIEDGFAKAEQKVKDLQAKDVPNLQVIKAQQAENAAMRAKLAPTMKKMDNAIAAMDARGKRMFDTADRLNEAKAFDIDDARQVILDSAEKMKGETVDMLYRRATRAERLREKINSLSPAAVAKIEAGYKEQIVKANLRLDKKWGANRAPDFDALANNLVGQYFDKVSGRAWLGNNSRMREHESPFDRGPMKDRTDLPVEDNDIQDFLHNDARQVLDRYARHGIADSELTRRLGSAQMYDHIDELRKNATEIRDSITAATTHQDVQRLAQLKPKRGEELEAFKARARTYLGKWESSNVTDLEAGRDMLRGMYAVAENQGAWGRTVTAFNQFQYMVRSGRFGISAMIDIFRPGFIHGHMNYMAQGVPALIKNLSSIGSEMAVREAKLAGLVWGKELNSRLMNMLEIGDPMGHGTRVERMMRNSVVWATWANRLGWLQDVGERGTSVLSQQRIYDAVISGNDTKYLGLINIGKGMRDNIAREMTTHSKVVDGVRIANTEAWENADAVDAFRAAMYKDVTSIIPVPSMFDKPLLMQYPFGKAFFQFRSYLMAANQRVMMRGMQEGRAAFVMQMVGLTTVGMFVSFLKAVGAGQEAFEKWQKQASNPGFMIGEGLDNSGVLPMMFEISNSIEKLTRDTGFTLNPIKSPMKMAFGGDRAVETTKYFDQDALRMMAGPTFGMLEDFTKAGHVGVKWLKGEAIKKSDIRALQNVTPGATMYGIREGIQILNDDSVYWKR